MQDFERSDIMEKYQIRNNNLLGNKYHIVELLQWMIKQWERQ